MLICSVSVNNVLQAYMVPRAVCLPQLVLLLKLFSEDPDALFRREELLLRQGAGVSAASASFKQIHTPIKSDNFAQEDGACRILSFACRSRVRRDHSLPLKNANFRRNHYGRLRAPHLPSCRDYLIHDRQAGEPCLASSAICCC